MTDSVVLYVGVEHVVPLEHEEIPFPFNIKQVINQDGEVISSKAESAYLKSPLTGASFVVTPVFRNKFVRVGELVGYIVSVNVPACVVGNNALLQILVYPACKFALEFLKYHLVQSGCSFHTVNQLVIEHCEIFDLTLTYLLECANKQEAKDVTQMIADYGEATLNTKHTNTKQKKPVVAISSAGLTTVTITKPRMFEAKAYVKVGATPKSFEKFVSSQIGQAIYAESGSLVRGEFNADRAWLKAKKGESPVAWKSAAFAEKTIQLALNTIRDYLRISDNLRSRRPKPEQLDALSTAERAIVEDYLNGADPKAHPLLVGKSAQYFSAVKCKMEQTLRMDITIPWKLHSTKISPHLSKWMQWNGQYQAPPALAPHCFVWATAKAKFKTLRRMLRVLGKKPVAVTTPAVQVVKKVATRKPKP